MCGILGIAATSPVSERGWLDEARDTLVHRGPDDGGTWWSADGRIGMAHRRLAIVDLTEGGHQPMHDASGALTIVFNGEIYNYLELQRELAARGHVFRSHSDTEVLLAAYREWGEDSLSKLNGMFAFALYDAARSTLLLARDRAGEKPLFYFADGRSLRFASELKALLSGGGLPCRIDAEAFDIYLAMGYVPGARCLVAGAAKLPPAHALSFDLRSAASRVWRYWSLPNSPGVDAEQREGQLLEEIEALLADAVKRQLHADVPVGVLLSGGVDSSLITAMAVRATRQVKTFTVGFSDFGAYDETEHARLVARHFDTEHIELDAGRITPDLMPMLARQYDEPMVDSSMIPTYLVSRLVRQHCTVALGGDGGDELFGGYMHYQRLLWTQRKIGWIAPMLRKPLAMAGRLLPIGFRGRNWLQASGTDFDRGLPLIATFFDPSTRRQLLHDAVAPRDWHCVAEAVWASRIPKGGDLLQRATRMEFENYMAEDILVKIDRASMLTSLELRSPLLDYRIIEFAFGRVPTGLKASAEGGRKILLKKLAGRLLPPEFDQKRKQGFSIPLAEWLRGGAWRDLFCDVLLDPQCLFTRRKVKSLLEGQDKGRINAERLFGLVLFELWRREYRMSI